MEDDHTTHILNWGEWEDNVDTDERGNYYTDGATCTVYLYPVDSIVGHADHYGYGDPIDTENIIWHTLEDFESPDVWEEAENKILARNGLQRENVELWPSAGSARH